MQIKLNDQVVIIENEGNEMYDCYVNTIGRVLEIDEVDQDALIRHFDGEELWWDLSELRKFGFNLEKEPVYMVENLVKTIRDLVDDFNAENDTKFAVGQMAIVEQLPDIEEEACEYCCDCGDCVEEVIVDSMPEDTLLCDDCGYCEIEDVEEVVIIESSEPDYYMVGVEVADIDDVALAVEILSALGTDIKVIPIKG